MYGLCRESDKREKGKIDETGAIDLPLFVRWQNANELQDVPREEQQSAADVVDAEFVDWSADARRIDEERVTEAARVERHRSCQSECDQKKEGKSGITRTKGPNDIENQQIETSHCHDSQHRTYRGAHHDKIGSENKADDPSVIRTISDEEFVVVNQEQPDVRVISNLCEERAQSASVRTTYRNARRFLNDTAPGAVAVSGPGDFVTTGSIHIGDSQSVIVESECPADTIIPEAYLVTDDDEHRSRYGRRCFLGLVTLTMIVIALSVALVLKSSSSPSADQWKALTESVLGEFESAHSGKSMAISADGTVLAIGEPGVDTVRVFEQVESSWILRGNPLIGPKGTSFGYTVDMTEDGKTVVAGGPNWETVEGTGIVQTYRWVLPDRAWRLLHEVKGNSTYGIHLGTDVTLSSSGITLALLAPYAAPHIEVWTSSITDLDQSQNFSLFSEYRDEVAPRTISLSGDGLMIAVQSEADAIGATSHVRLLKLDRAEDVTGNVTKVWKVQGTPINGNVTVVSRNADVMAVGVATSLRDSSKVTDKSVDDDSLVDDNFF
jgi:hypothetical protein